MKRIFCAVLCLLLILGGCSNHGQGKQASIQSTTNTNEEESRVIFTIVDSRSKPTDLTGKYVAKKYPDSYFEIYEDGTAALSKQLETFGKYNQVSYDMWLEINEDKEDGKTRLSFQYYDGAWWVSLVQFFQQNDDTFILVDLGGEWDDTYPFIKQ